MDAKCCDFVFTPLVIKEEQVNMRASRDDRPVIFDLRVNRQFHYPSDRNKLPGFKSAIVEK